MGGLADVQGNTAASITQTLTSPASTLGFWTHHPMVLVPLAEVTKSKVPSGFQFPELRVSDIFHSDIDGDLDYNLLKLWQAML